jgi:hypothetical protein
MTYSEALGLSVPMPLPRLKTICSPSGEKSGVRSGTEFFVSWSTLPPSPSIA